MLVLSRKLNESIVIEDGKVELTILQVKGDKVRIGFKANAEIPIHRKEIYEAIQLEKESSGA